MPIQPEFIDKLHAKINDLKNQLKQHELRQRAKRKLFGDLSVERLAEENKRLTDENEELHIQVKALLAGRQQDCSESSECLLPK